MTKAILTCFHKYTPFGDEFYEPILSFYLSQMRKWVKEYDKIYLLDSTWNIDLFDKYKSWNIEKQDWNVEIIKVDPSLRYYDAYKWFLPQVKETAVLLTDNDLVVYKPQMIADAFAFLDDGYSVVSIYDTIGKTFEKLGGKSKTCPYWFCTRKNLLMRYRDVDWSPDGMPEYETFGKLTEAMLKDRIFMYEWPEDKNSIYIDGSQDGDKSEDTGTYHIRSGSVPAYLLATKHYGNADTYWEYIHNQPKREYVRQSAWYRYMGGNPLEIITDAGIPDNDWDEYYIRFKKYHHLK